MENFNFDELVNNFTINDGVDYSDKKNLVRLAKEAMQYAYSKKFKETIDNQNIRLSNYESKELHNRLKGKIKDEFINDFIQLKSITNNLDEKELNKIINENKHYKILKEEKKEEKTNDIMDGVLNGKSNPDKNDFDPNNPYNIV